MNTEILNVRIPQEIRGLMESECQRNNVSMSILVRQILQNHYYPIQEDESDDFDFDFDHFVFSIEFKNLFKWIVQKGQQPENNSRIDILQQHASVVSIIQNSQYDFPLEIRNEFNKILVELNTFLNNPYSSSYFTFGLTTSNNRFNYDVVIDFLLTKGLERISYIQM